MSTETKAVEIPESHLEILQKKGFAHVATIGPGGEPHSSPVWYDWDGEYILFSQTKTRRKYRNLQKDARIALSVLDPDNPYHYLEIRGVVHSVEDDPNSAFIDSLSKKYLGLEKYPYPQPGDERIVLKVTPSHLSFMG
ncbi:MAG: PPOX class F420-dependent oxidoreductase [Actinomycetota bacterium]